MAKSTVEILREARELISDPERWTRGWFARDKNGYPVYGYESEATCWCGFGAVQRVEPKATATAQGLLDNAAQDLGEGSCFPEVNDGPRLWAIAGETADRKPRPAPARHKRVLAVYDRAIELAEGEAT